MYSEVFSSRLRKARENFDLSQSEFSEILKIGRSTYTHYENGTREPSFETLIQIAVALEVTTDWLLGITAYGGPNIKERFIRKRQIAPDMSKRELIEYFILKVQ